MYNKYGNNNKFGNNNNNKHSSSQNKWSWWFDRFMDWYLNEFDNSRFAEFISYKKIENYKSDLEKISSSSSLRKIYDNYVDIIEWDEKKIEIKVQVWLAKIWYQQSRNNSSLPKWMMQFFEEMYSKINNPYRFKEFLEVLVAYHKVLCPRS